MSKNSLVTIVPVLLSGSVAAMLGLSLPALARGGGHHHGECGEHHTAYGCGYPNYKVWHHRGHHERYFGYHHRSEYPRDIQYLPDTERAPLLPDAAQAPVEPK